MTVEGTSGNPSQDWNDRAAPVLPDVEQSTEQDRDPGGWASVSEATSTEASRLADEEALQSELPFAEEPVALTAADGMSALGEAAAARGYLWIPLPKPGPAHRGRLGLFIEETIEHELDERGALPPGIVSSSGLDASLSDQLYRARLIEKRGLALGVPSLEGITNLGRTLDADDSSVLRWWMAATSDRPVRLLIDRENTKLRVYPSPVFFDSLFDVAPAPVSPRPANVAMAESSDSMELSDLPPSVEEHETNVLGTEVESLEVGADDGFPMPELDRALGLTPDESEVEPLAAQEGSGRHAERQLTLTYDEAEPSREPSPRTPTLIATVAPPADEDLEDQSPDSAALPSREATTEFPLDNEASSDPVEEPVVSSEARGPEVDDRDATDLDAGDLDAGELEADDLDADDFLQTLAEDSAKVPQARWEHEEVDEATGSEADWEEDATDVDEVPTAYAEPSAPAEPSGDAPEPDDAECSGSSESVAEPGPVADGPDDSQPSPLPTKAVRNPFIRMATPQEAPQAPKNAPSEASVEAPPEEEESVAAPRVESAPPFESESVAAPAPDPQDPFNQLAAREWKSWVSHLEAARGPKPLSVIERMFVTDYTRLREAVRRGVADESALGILDEWRDSFTSSYSEAFDALRVRGKRPTMVLDLPELAARLGRLQGAKRVQLLMVDGLRFDLGLMVQDRMRQSADASLTERLLLWSALPTVTSVQLELLGKGADGLKGDLTPDETPALVARGRAAMTPRRVRTGSLELYKLDVVEDSLREAGKPVLQRLDQIAERTADALVAHLGKQPARTMVIIFGDHGFALDPAAAGTTEEVLQGGATPEEVLVPAFAWLTGAVH